MLSAKQQMLHKGLWKKKTCEVRRQTLLHLFFWLMSQSGRIPPKSPEVREERAPSNDSLRSAQLPQVETGMFELAYETAKGVNIHFYLLSKLFMSISPHCTQPQTHGGGTRTSEMDKQGLCHCERLLLCGARDCGGSEYFIERSLWHEMNTLFRLDVKAPHLKPSHLLP